MDDMRQDEWQIGRSDTRSSLLLTNGRTVEQQMQPNVRLAHTGQMSWVASKLVANEN